MGLDQFHPFCDPEIAKVPRKPGVFVLFQIQIPIHVDSAEDLRKGLVRGKRQFPGASHFSVEAVTGDARSIRHRVREIRERLKLVRTGAFVGSSG
jgi:hypothetical protein